MRKPFIMLFVFILSAFSLTACNGNDEGQNNNANTNDLIHVKNSEMEQNEENLSNQEMAEHLANIAGDVPGVNGASALVFGPYTLVGIDVDEELDRTRVGTLKYSVAEAIKHEKNGANAMVMADGDITERLRRMGDKISQGHPEDAIMDELAAIVGRYMPEVPQKDNQPEEPNTNQKLLEEQQKEELDNIQEDQSNNYMNQ
ncbi:YhcN/YlaJ family sporulation lipoprotein [Salirhabdus euzebyi]|uniref:YhcN/YlaJ family sporulation lipoprotein n=1 Tax=Salirhabdus euzebyi TaxID=394506 RepID=A0A841Q920_9BACI|nr:YhcN/YlaJ family sporulation lipoprotein [Salirhabdus euzebyi]MBB6454981.1 YhcN/YlaJ family sporulation lipoprotein [Salirhabdus euzebyi]